MSNKINKKTIIYSIITLLLFSSIGVTKIFKDDHGINNDLQTGVSTQGMKIKMLEQGTNDEGRSYVTYSYEVTPDYATNKNIAVKSLNYSNSDLNDANEYVEVEIDNNNSKFTVTKLQDFDKQIKLTLMCEGDNSVTADVLIDCKQRWLGFSNVDETAFHNTSYNAVKLDSYDNELFSIVDGGYSSIYTIPLTKETATIKERTTIKVVEVYSNSNNADFVELDENILTSENVEVTVLKSQIENFIGGSEFNLNNSMFIKNDINQKWSDQKKLEIKEYKFYGFKLTQDVTFLLYGEEHTIQVNYYMTYYVSSLSLTIKPTSLEIESNQIIL